VGKTAIMLQKSASFPGIQGPIVTIVMDGYGIAKSDVGSAIAAARKPTLDRLFAKYPNITLRAHGVAVGMPSDDDMGNSEVGHNAIGAGQVYSQGASLVADAIASGSIWQGAAWQESHRQRQGRAGVMHFIGLFSDGNVHSHIDHLRAMIVRAKEEGVRRCAFTSCSTAVTFPRPARSIMYCPSKLSWPKSTMTASTPASPRAAGA
jgi:2,3-bisphosphoglycerate-independent phosphoglycerate mutase